MKNHKISEQKRCRYSGGNSGVCRKIL